MKASGRNTRSRDEYWTTEPNADSEPPYQLVETGDKKMETSLVHLEKTNEFTNNNTSDCDSLIHGGNPEDLIESAKRIANVLAATIRDRGLSIKIDGGEYVKVDGWTTMAALLGYIPEERSVESDSNGCYIAHVGLRMRNGSQLPAASAECGGPQEPRWNKRPPYARRSMALTRAAGKACRLSFGWIMSLAGYETTPVEEMPEPKDLHETLQSAEVADDPINKIANAFMSYDIKIEELEAYLCLSRCYWDSNVISRLRKEYAEILSITKQDDRIKHIESKFRSIQK